jgi:hypothetical protein
MLNVVVAAAAAAAAAASAAAHHPSSLTDKHIFFANAIAMWASSSLQMNDWHDIMISC